MFFETTFLCRKISALESFFNKLMDQKKTLSEVGFCEFCDFFYNKLYRTFPHHYLCKVFCRYASNTYKLFRIDTVNIDNTVDIVTKFCSYKTNQHREKNPYIIVPSILSQQHCAYDFSVDGNVKIGSFIMLFVTIYTKSLAKSLKEPSLWVEIK